MAHASVERLRAQSLEPRRGGFSFLRTISGRVTLGFVVLLVSFGSVAGYTLVGMSQLGRALGYLRSAYLDVIPKVARVSSLAASNHDYLEEPSPSRVRVARNREFRAAQLAQIDELLRDPGDVPATYRPELDWMRKKLAHQIAEHRRVEPIFDAAFRQGRAPEAMERLRQEEWRFLTEEQGFQKRLQDAARLITRRLEEAERDARVWALFMGGVAILLAGLVATWTALTLRPLARLRDGVRRVARGDYRGRVATTGGTEVAELADEFNRMAAAIQEREQELVRSERLAAVGKMAAVITHEVRNPLSSIGLNAELLEEELARASGGTPSPEASQLLRSVQNEVDRLTAITEEYLKFARLPRPRLEPEEVNPIVRSVAEFQREELALRGVRIVVALADALPPVAVDEAQLRQALLNLVRNGADAVAGRARAEVTLATTRAVDGMVEISVADDGPGVPEELRERIFEPFFSTKEGGTGLGLALVQQIALEQGGRVVLECPASGGTRFVLRLPAVPLAPTDSGPVSVPRG